MDAKDLLPVGIEYDEPCDPQIEAVAELEEAAQRLDLETWIVNKLRHCERELTVNIPLLRDDGPATTCTGLRVQHVCWRGPSTGVVALSPNAHITAVRAAAMGATWQAALLDLPVGGAAGAVVCDPESLSERELRQLAREYVYGLRGVLGRHSDVIMPGIGCNGQIMSWMLDAHAQTLGRMERGTITGLPAVLSGLACSNAPIARGVIALLRHLLANRRAHSPHCATTTNNRLIAGQRASVQGFGAVGSAIARALYDNGSRITAVADISGGVSNTTGLDIPSLQQHVRRNGVVFGFPAADACSNVDILESNCDLLITAATERQVTTPLSRKVNASMVVEATRSAVTHGAESALQARGILVVPEILTTAASLVASHLEWKQAEEIAELSPEAIDRELERRVVRACNLVFECADAQKLTPRRAAHLIALDRIASEMRLRS